LNKTRLCPRDTSQREKKVRGFRDCVDARWLKGGDSRRGKRKHNASKGGGKHRPNKGRAKKRGKKQVGFQLVCFRLLRMKGVEVVMRYQCGGGQKARSLFPRKVPERQDGASPPRGKRVVKEGGQGGGVTWGDLVEGGGKTQNRGGKIGKEKMGGKKNSYPQLRRGGTDKTKGEVNERRSSA